MKRQWTKLALFSFRFSIKQSLSKSSSKELRQEIITRPLSLICQDNFREQNRYLFLFRNFHLHLTKLTNLHFPPFLIYILQKIYQFIKFLENIFSAGKRMALAFKCCWLNACYVMYRLRIMSIRVVFKFPPLLHPPWTSS